MVATRIKGGDMPLQEKSYDVCDDCLMPAYDFLSRTMRGEDPGDYDKQAAIMVKVGDSVEDHLCITIEIADRKCDCACRK